MNNEPDSKTVFNFDKANLADQLTVVGEVEHLYMHACKAAASCEKEEDAVFYMVLADETKRFRRDFMKEHFQDVMEKDWCILKAIESIRQRIYESANTSYKDLHAINSLWAMVIEHIFGIDLSGCASCATDKEEDPLQREEGRE